jgi:hypothetical protein
LETVPGTVPKTEPGIAFLAEDEVPHVREDSFPILFQPLDIVPINLVDHLLRDVAHELDEHAFLPGMLSSIVIP